MSTTTEIKHALDHVRTAAQELHNVIDDAAAKHGAETKADLERFAQKAKAVAESIKASMGAEHEAAKKAFAEALAHLEAAQKHIAEGQKHIAEGAKTSGKAVESAVTKALGEARASIDKINKAVASR